MKTEYSDYFKQHYKSTLTEKDIVIYRQWFDRQWRIINQKIAITPSSEILEIGSGFGGFYGFIRDSGNQSYTGLELDPEAAAFANRYYDTQVFKVSSIEDYNPPTTYDIIFAFEVLEHIDNPGETIAKIHKMLKPGGVFCATSPYPFKKNIDADDTHVSVLHPANWRRLFQRTGFTDISSHPMSFLPLVWRINKKANIKLPFYIPFQGFISTCLFIVQK